MQTVQGFQSRLGRDILNMNNIHRIQGFTLIETIVTLAVAVILIMFGVPSMRDFALNSRQSAQSNEFVTGIQLARSTAIKQQRNASICVSTTYNNTPPTCTGGTDWSDGWVVWVDQDSDGVLDATEVLRVGEPLDGSSTFTSTASSSFRYAPTGLVNGQDTLTLCDNRSGETGRQITVNAAGRVNLARMICP
jgi:type IV fimbrial biogenesis protein FimT